MSHCSLFLTVYVDLCKTYSVTFCKTMCKQEITTKLIYENKTMFYSLLNHKRRSDIKSQETMRIQLKAFNVSDSFDRFSLLDSFDEEEILS